MTSVFWLTVTFAALTVAGVVAAAWVDRASEFVESIDNHPHRRAMRCLHHRHQDDRSNREEEA